MNKQHQATVFGVSAIILWGMLALLTSFCKSIPTYQLTAMTFFIAFLLGLVYFIHSGSNWKAFRQPPSVWINGIVGLFGYHALYFMAMKSAPAVEASLIAYLWPVLIVLFSSFLPGEKLHWFHVLGVVLGFIGVAVLLQAGGSISLNSAYVPGYVFALLCALIWSVYSVVSRKNKNVSTILTVAFCGATSILAFLCHLIFEKTVIPQTSEWLAILALGIGPVGVAFFAWDYGMKHGNIKLLGTLSYVAPLLSSALLVCFGKTAFNWSLLSACVLIAGGSMVSSLGGMRKSKIT